jgi:SAM-dependent methyltransferase
MTFEPRFGHAADAYTTYRPEYPDQLYERILAEVPPGSRERAMDLGAGTGISTRALAKHFSEVIAVEPDRLMAEKLRGAGPRVRVRLTTAEECEQEPASVDLVNIATALHWMEVARVMVNAARWLRRGGVLAVSGGAFPATPGPIRAILEREFAEHWDAFRDARLRRKEFPQSLVRNANGLKISDKITIPYVVALTAEEFAGFCGSTSYGSAFARTLADADSYWRDLAARIRAAWPEERFPVDFSLWLIVARKE